MLDERSPVPLYYQLQEIIRSRIESGQWKPGEQLPPEADLCDEFNLSRGTVRQALADLVREGMLHRRRGKGSFIAQPKIPQDLLTIAGFSAYAKGVVGMELGSRLISVNVIPANSSIARKLEVAEGTDIVEVRKVKLAEGRPFFLATSFVLRDAFPGIEGQDHTTGSIFQLLQDKYAFQVTRVKGWFEPVLVNDYEAQALDVEKGSPAMMYERIRYSGDRPLMLSKHIIRGDVCRFTFQVEGSEVNGNRN